MLPGSGLLRRRLAGPVVDAVADDPVVQPEHETEQPCSAQDPGAEERPGRSWNVHRAQDVAQNAKIVPATTTHIVGTQGHVHVILDNKLVSMTYRLKQTLGNLTPGTHLLRAQFVASDHAPFNPPVFAQAVTFTVKP